MGVGPVKTDFHGLLEDILYFIVDTLDAHPIGAQISALHGRKLIKRVQVALEELETL